MTSRGSTIFARLEDCARHFPQRDALVFAPKAGRYTVNSYRQLHDRALELERGCRRLGVRPEDRIVFWNVVDPDAVALLFALFAIGAMPVFVDPSTPSAELGLEGTMRHMAGRKRHSAEDIVRKLRRADELAAEGKTGEEIAAELGVSAATLYNWRRAYGGMDPDAAKELKELREQNARLKRLLAEAELVKDALREVAKGKF